MFSRTDHIPGHISALSKYKKIDHTMHIFRPQRYEIRNQPQEKTWKGNKYLDTKEHPTKE